MERKIGKLRACPFCGRPDPVIRVIEADGERMYQNRYAVLCHYEYGGCGAEGGFGYSPEEAIALWNERRRSWRG